MWLKFTILLWYKRYHTFSSVTLMIYHHWLQVARGQVCMRQNEWFLIAGIIHHWFRTHSRFAPSQWETALLCNDVTHWLGASLESASRFAPSQWETALFCNDVAHWLGASLESARFSPSQWERALLPGKHTVLGLYSETQQGLILLTNLHWRFLSWSKKTFFCGPNSYHAISTKFCTCYDSCAVVAYAKICSNLIINIWTVDTFVCIRL